MDYELRLLEAIGYIQDAYILDAHAEQPKTGSRKKLLLIAAAAAILLLLAGCAIYAWHWYTDYFTQKHQEPLSDSQIGYINDNAREHQTSQTFDGYTLELKSTLTENYTAYATFCLTAPEDGNLPSPLALTPYESLSLRGLLATQADSKLPANLSYSVHDDGDGKDNTLNIVLCINPVFNQGEAVPFSPDRPWKVTIQDIVKWGYDAAYEQELLTTKYAGQTGYMLEPEESRRVHPETVLASGNWEFLLALEPTDTGDMELLTSPVSTKAFVTRIGTSEFDILDSIEDITLTSIRLNPLSMQITFEKPEPVSSFNEACIDISAFSRPDLNIGENDRIVLVMKDGSSIRFFQSEGARETAYLTADCPVIFEDALYLQLSDGTQIPVHPAS